MVAKKPKKPIRKVNAAAAGGLPVAAGVVALVGWLWPALPEPVAGLIGAAVAAGIAYMVPSAPGEPRPAPAPGNVI
jgi:hypothetical protein